jgi:NADH dehydrogenase
VSIARPRVVIIGGGFAGLRAARAFKGANADVTVIDRTNHHLFQPLLYQVATASLSASDISAPIRHALRKQKNTRVFLAEVRGVDVEQRVVHIDVPDREIPYDYLIVATGSHHAYFGHDEWAEFAPGLKAIEDAAEIRRRFLLAFERAEKSMDAAERDAFMTFVIVGAGPTGSELAGAMPEITRRALYPDFRSIDTRSARVILVEGGARILPTFPEDLAEHAHRDLVELGVEVRTGSIVTKIEPGAVYIGDEKISANTVFWAAGNKASSVGGMLGAKTDRVGRVLVKPDLSIPNHPEVFVVGDLAYIERADGRPVPGVAPAAMQEGTHAAKNVRRLMGHLPAKPFRYWNKGDLAVIGRRKAIADFGRLRFSGRIAWILWLTIHITYLIGFRNRLSVLIQWAYSYFTFQRGVRLITNVERKPS